MNKKVTIIGAGSVGSTIAFTMAAKGVAQEIVMIDIAEKKVLGEALDIRQGLPFCPAGIKIYAGSYADAAGSDIVVITSGIARKPGQTRLELAQTNVNIIKSITPSIVKYCPDSVYVIVSNPVDILTYVFTKISGIPEHRILGSGTLLDTARLRARLAEYYQTDTHNIEAYVLGEHGDSSFVPWSLFKLGSKGEKEFAAAKAEMGEILPELDKEEAEKYMKTSGARVIGRKGATFHAVSLSVCYICEAVLNNTNEVLNVSTMMHGEHGVDDVCLSYFTVVNCDGASAKVATPLTAEEEAKLQNSANCLKNILSGISL